MRLEGRRGWVRLKEEGLGESWRRRGWVRWRRRRVWVRLEEEELSEKLEEEGLGEVDRRGTKRKRTRGTPPSPFVQQWHWATDIIAKYCRNNFLVVIVN